MSELALDHDERDALVRHLDRVSVPELVRREPAPDTGCERLRDVAACARRMLPSAVRRSVHG